MSCRDEGTVKGICRLLLLPYIAPLLTLPVTNAPSTPLPLSPQSRDSAAEVLSLFNFSTSFIAQLASELKLDAAGSSGEGPSFLSSMFNKKNGGKGGAKPAPLDPSKNLVVGTARCFPTSPEEEVRGARG